MDLSKYKKKINVVDLNYVVDFGKWEGSSIKEIMEEDGQPAVVV